MAALFLLLGSIDQARATAPDPLRIMPLGDSNTYGYFAEGYRADLDILLRQFFSLLNLPSFTVLAVENRHPQRNEYNYLGTSAHLHLSCR